jgi:hypothetical protein
MNIESGPSSAAAQRFERLGGVVGQRELVWKLRRSNGERMSMVDAISGFE